MSIKTSAYSLSVLFILSIVLSNCKYEEGPAVSLRSKKERVANTWIVEYAENEEGDDVTDDYDNIVLNTTKDGNFTLETGGFTFEGEWTFVNDKEGIRFMYDSGGSETHDILKLKEKEMWTVSNDDNDEIHWVPK